MNYEDLVLNKEVQSSNDSGKIDNSESDKWSTEVEELYDRKFHKWIGEKLDSSGVWVNDNTADALMNKKCANRLINLLDSCFNKNMNFSVLDDKEINWIVASTMDDVVDLVCDNYEEFGIKPGDFGSIFREVWNTIYGLLKIPYMGGMRTHLGDKSRTIINKQEMSNGAF